MQDLKPLSIYIHIPFCRKRCAYCDFNTYAGRGNYISDYSKAIVAEILHYSRFLKEGFFISTIYFGGGTPTVLPIRIFEKILKSIIHNFKVSPHLEITTEGNPGDLNEDYLSGLIKTGIARLSIGMQSGIIEELEILDRSHDLDSVYAAALAARFAGFENINLDLIFGIPTQTLESFRKSVNAALEIGPQHLSLYGLSLEPSTTLADRISSDELSAVDNDSTGEMYEWVMDYLSAHGFSQYEISNWVFASDIGDFRCLHNLQYWKNLDYLGIGAGAHSFLDSYRWNNIRLIPEYINKILDQPKPEDRRHAAVDKFDQLEKIEIIKETMMMGLRLTRVGINKQKFFERFSLRVEDIYPRQIEKLLKQDLIEYHLENGCNHIRLTKKGRMVGNQVFLEFI